MRIEEKLLLYDSNKNNINTQSIFLILILAKINFASTI